MAILIGVLSFIPSILYYFFLKGLRKEDDQYRKDCRKTLGRGLLSGFPIFLLDLAIVLVMNLLGLTDKVSPVVRDLFKCFVINAFVEELVKVWIGKKMIKKNRDTVSWLDMIAFITISSIGFEIAESAVYMLTTGAGQMIVRGISMMHIVFGLIEGWYNGKYVSTGDKKYMVLSMAVSIFIHGIYNFGLSDNAPEFFGVFSLIFAAGSVVFWIYMIFYIRKKKVDPEFTSPMYGAKEEVTEV